MSRIDRPNLALEEGGRRDPAAWRWRRVNRKDRPSQEGESNTQELEREGLGRVDSQKGEGLIYPREKVNSTRARRVRRASTRPRRLNMNRPARDG